MSKATRDAFGEAIRDLGEKYAKVVVLDADLSVSTKSVHFAKKYPERFFQLGIAEANMVGTAAGLAFQGFVPFCCSFGCFVAGRFETIRVSVGYSQANVKIVGTHAGLGTGEDGYTQMGLEDVTLMRGLPGMVVLNPCDERSTKEAVEFAIQHQGPVYLRLTRQKLPHVYTESLGFKIGKASVIKQGSGPVVFFATGSTVAESLKASEALSALDPSVVDFTTLKPIDREAIIAFGQKAKFIVTVEDHNIIGGLGSAVGEVMAESGVSAKLIRLGVQDTYGESGEAGLLYEKYGISANRIAEKVRSLL